MTELLKVGTVKMRGKKTTRIYNSRRGTPAGRIFTISSYNRVQNVEYGVLREENGMLTGFSEKPKLDYLVSMGIYAASNEILHYIPSNTFFGFDDLMDSLLEHQEEVELRLHHGYWLDIGRPDDYQIATDEFEKNKDLFLKENDA